MLYNTILPGFPSLTTPFSLWSIKMNHTKISTSKMFAYKIEYNSNLKVIEMIYNVS